MHELLPFLKSQAYLVLFLSVLGDQASISIPSQPALIGMGVLIAAGSHSPLLALGVAVLGAVLADLLWYGIGRSWGAAGIGLFRKRRPRLAGPLARAQSFVVRREWLTFLASKFGPAPSFPVPLLAGAGRLPVLCFVLVDAVVCASWSLVFLAIGYFAARAW